MHHDTRQINGRKLVAQILETMLEQEQGQRRLAGSGWRCQQGSAAVQSNHPGMQEVKVRTLMLQSNGEALVEVKEKRSRIAARSHVVDPAVLDYISAGCIATSDVVLEIPDRCSRIARHHQSTKNVKEQRPRCSVVTTYENAALTGTQDNGWTCRVTRDRWTYAFPDFAGPDSCQGSTAHGELLSLRVVYLFALVPLLLFVLLVVPLAFGLSRVVMSFLSRVLLVLALARGILAPASFLPLLMVPCTRTV
jgi:hypothetical protein